MKDWGHAHLENDCIVQKLIGWFKQNEHEAAVCFHTQNTELIPWWREVKQMLPDLPWGHLSNLQTADSRDQTQLRALLEGESLQPFTYTTDTADNKSGLACNFRTLSLEKCLFTQEQCKEVSRLFSDIEELSLYWLDQLLCKYYETGLLLPLL